MTVKLAYSVEEAAQAIGIGRTLMYERIASGEIRSIRVGRRRVITAEALENFVRALVDQQGQEAARRGA